MNDEPINPIRADEPIDRLTRIAGAMTDVFRDHPEMVDTDKCLVLVVGADSIGASVAGYDDDTTAVVDLFMFLRTLLVTNGMDVEFIAVPNSPAGAHG